MPSSDSFPLAIDLCSGAGGLSYGFASSGFRLALAVEKDEKAARTYQTNHIRTDVRCEDIATPDAPRTYRNALGIGKGQLMALIGSPPCRGFSESNRRTRNLDNPSNHLYKYFFDFIDEFEPSWFIFENVAGLLTLARGVVLENILKEGRDRGYACTWKELNAADYGVPQFRRRVFIVGNRTGVPFEFPEATHGVKTMPYVTVREGLSDLPDLGNGASTNEVAYAKPAQTEYQRLMRAQSESNLATDCLVTRNAAKIIQRYKHIGQGQNWEAIPPELLDDYTDASRCHTGIYYRLRWDAPAKVIGNFRKNMLIHPRHHRGLSVREAARLQSFPDHYQFTGSIGFRQQQVGDAVPPLMAQAVANQVLHYLDTA